MSDTVVGILIGASVTSIVAPIVLGLFNRFLSKNKDGTELAQNALNVANQAVDDLAKEKTVSAQARVKISELERKVLALEAAHQGPFRLVVEFDTRPTPFVRETELTLLSSKE